MFQLLNKEDYNKIAPITDSVEIHCTFAYGVIKSGMPGKIYVDHADSPTCCVVAADAGAYLVAGDEHNESFNKALLDFLGDKKQHIIYYDLYATSKEWLDIINNGLGRHVVRLDRSIYTYCAKTAPAFHKAKNALDEGFELKKMDASLAKQYIKSVPLCGSNWGSAEAFVEKGIGYVILHKGEIECICYSGHTGGGYANIGIITNEGHRNKGFALITCSAFIEECLERGITPVWDAGKFNEPSNKLAHKLNFQFIHDTELIFWHEDYSVIQGYYDGTNFM